MTLTPSPFPRSCEVKGYCKISCQCLKKKRCWHHTSWMVWQMWTKLAKIYIVMCKITDYFFCDLGLFSRSLYVLEGWKNTLSAPFLFNGSTDLNKTCTKSLGEGKGLIGFWWPWPKFLICQAIWTQIRLLPRGSSLIMVHIVCFHEKI